MIHSRAAKEPRVQPFHGMPVCSGSKPENTERIVTFGTIFVGKFSSTYILKISPYKININFLGHNNSIVIILGDSFLSFREMH